YDNAERYKDLYHGEHFRPPGQQRGIRWSERGTLRKCDEGIVDKTWLPVFHAESSPLEFFNLHLREYETVASEFMAPFTDGRSPAIEPPVPQCKNENVRDPKLHARQQQTQRRFCVRRQCPDQQKNGPDQRNRDDAAIHDSEHMIKRVPSCTVRDNCRR